MSFDSAQVASGVLGCEGEELHTAVFKHHLRQLLQKATGGSRERGGAESDEGETHTPTGKNLKGQFHPKSEILIFSDQVAISGFLKCIFYLFPSGPRLTAAQCVDGMAAGLYEELFTAVVSLINRYGRLSQAGFTPVVWLIRSNILFLVWFLFLLRLTGKSLIGLFWRLSSIIRIHEGESKQHSSILISYLCS